MKSVKGILSLLFLFAPFYFCCTNTQAPMKITVELDVFSGRPNPAWVVEKDEADKVNNTLQNLPASKSPAPVSSDGLGYRGFLLTREQRGKKEAIHVYANLVWLDHNPERVLEDKNHAEQMLLQMAREKGYGKLLEDLGVK